MNKIADGKGTKLRKAKSAKKIRKKLKSLFRKRL